MKDLNKKKIEILEKMKEELKEIGRCLNSDMPEYKNMGMCLFLKNLIVFNCFCDRFGGFKDAALDMICSEGVMFKCEGGFIYFEDKHNTYGGLELDISNYYTVFYLIDSEIAKLKRKEGQ
jgi:hypothetical protein